MRCIKKEFADYNELLVALKKQDIEAFDFLYTDTRVWLYGVVYNILQDDQVSQDLVQDFFIDFWEFRLYNQIESSLKGYLIKSLTNRAFNLLDKKNTQHKLQNDFIYPANIIMPALQMERDQLGSAIKQALKHVPAASAHAFTLHYISGLTHVQIAEQLSISPHTVRNHISKALKILRSELKNVQNE